MREILLFFSIKYSGNWEKIYKALEEKEIINSNEISKVIQNMKGNYITILDNNYPEPLKHITKPPFIIFYFGNLKLIDDYKSSIGFTGTKKITKQTWNDVKSLVDEIILSKKTLVVGALEGPESYVLNEIRKNGKGIGILTNGIDFDFLENFDKKINIKKILLLSEVPFPHSPNYLDLKRRNKLINSFSGSLFVSSITKDNEIIKDIVNRARSEDKKIFCLPDSTSSRTCNNDLIKSGAILIENIKN